jgi:hypothetical protein
MYRRASYHFFETFGEKQQGGFLETLCLHDQDLDLPDDASKLMLVFKTTLIDFYAMVSYAS